MSSQHSESVTARLSSGRTGQALFLLATMGNIGSSTTLIWLAANGATVVAVLPFCAVTWGCYFCGHYLVDGELVDRTTADRSLSLPGSTGLRALAVVGLGSMVLAFPTGIVAVRNGSFPLLVVSLTLFVGGYNVGHYGLTLKPL
ncbi:MAG: hypothetical protein V5A38_02555 [Halolamina sp.]|uniref:hypothetical protein n=1 Tax=Halolamina sp. TaxID=1940283 RepID=UPI002FC2FB16